MKQEKSKTYKEFFEQFAKRITFLSGSTTAFILAIFSVIVWGATGPLLDYSDTWQLVINTFTDIVIFLMVFLIQRSQNKDSLAVHLKLNELIAALHGASNRLIDVENLSEDELDIMHNYFQMLAEKTKRESNIKAVKSIEDAKNFHERTENDEDGRKEGNGN